MRILVIGGTGTIGREVVRALEAGNEVVVSGRHHGDVPVDLGDAASVRALLERVGQVDAIVSAAGQARWKPFAELTDEDFAFSLANKLMGQVNIVRHGFAHVRDGGSITVTSGVLAQSPMRGSGAVSLVNAGLEGFARAAALEAPRGIRVNVVSPAWVSETLDAMGQDPSFGVPAAKVARAYVEAVTGKANGQVIAATR